jgi:hypothetical protein
LLLSVRESEKSQFKGTKFCALYHFPFSLLLGLGLEKKLIVKSQFYSFLS